MCRKLPIVMWMNYWTAWQPSIKWWRDHSWQLKRRKCAPTRPDIPHWPQSSVMRMGEASSATGLRGLWLQYPWPIRGMSEHWVPPVPRTVCLWVRSPLCVCCAFVICVLVFVISWVLTVCIMLWTWGILMMVLRMMMVLRIMMVVAMVTERRIYVETTTPWPSWTYVVDTGGRWLPLVMELDVLSLWVVAGPGTWDCCCWWVH